MQRQRDTIAQGTSVAVLKERQSIMQRQSIKMPNVLNTVLEKIVNELNKQQESAVEADEGFVEMPALQRKLSVVQGKIRFNGKFLDPKILKKHDWELNADEKYEKGIFEHVKAKVHSEKSKDPRV